ncbi:zinc finger protein CONSTANS-LIKE 9-like [Hibiscus syriacus]|uniref:zinc finger protein CONSTANS-LIKE 9-like n=1 Tax=Hibiscus syriacus TaxID=106335 RepID=UPI0019224321|nr:zinc finger protein CONSTANS-LIKE 9-like [Hibiscus syriacus]
MSFGQSHISTQTWESRWVPQAAQTLVVEMNSYSHSVDILYCSADSTSLSLFCGQQVHSTNVLSLKHVRSQICDCYKAKLASFLYSDDNLMLCHNCHQNSCNASNCCGLSTHPYSPVEGFPGRHSVIQLVSLFGFDLKLKDLMDLIHGFSLYERELTNIKDFMPPEENSCVSSALLSSVKLDHEVYRQLVKMGKRDLVRVSDDGDEEYKW